ncbi:MAG: hypothetical protein GXO47_12550 [Chlorobi bacterium]|nr:hypothetical protein [Chlorobiota bacterium]
MKYEITTLKYKTREVIITLLFYFLLLIVFLLIFYFGLHFDLENIITSSFFALLTIFFILHFNKNSVLKISDYSNTAIVKNTIIWVLSKMGFVKTEESNEKIKFQYRSKTNRFIASFFLDQVTMKISDNEIWLYGNKNRMLSLKVRVQQEMEK